MTSPQSTNNPFNEAYWNQRYQNGTTGWDIGKASQPLVAYIDQLEDRDMRIMIPGCGNGYEAAYLHEKGFKNITVVDVSQEAVMHLRKKMPIEIKIKHKDFFELNGKYDLILEQTFFCALHPSMRKIYAAKMYELLNPDGKLAGVFFNRTFENDGPPFGGNLEEYIELFSTNFIIHAAAPCYTSIPERANTEVFMILKK